MSETWRDYLAVWRGCFDEDFLVRWVCRVGFLAEAGPLVSSKVG